MRVPLVLVTLAFTAACSRSSTPRAAPSSPTTAAAACGGTKVTRGGQPSWSSSAGSLDGLPYVVSDEENVAGFLFAPSLRAGHPTNPSNKILWVVREPRNGQPLHVTAVPDKSTTTIVTDDFPANSSPGEIYPSIVDVPAPGCWRFTLTWSGHRAGLSLRYTVPSDG